MGPVGAAIAGAGIAAGGRILGTAMSNQASAKQAKLNRQFQERMSNTAYQRAASDLESAGLNRILAIGSPASTPGGAMGNVHNFGDVASAVDTGASIFSTAKQAQATDQQIEQSKAQADKILMETKGIEHQNKIKLAQSEIWEALSPVVIQGAKGINDLAEFLQKPANWQDFVEMVGREKSNVIGWLKDFVINRYKNSPQGKGLTILIDRARDAYTTYKDK